MGGTERKMGLADTTGGKKFFMKGKRIGARLVQASKCIKHAFLKKT